MCRNSGISLSTLQLNRPCRRCPSWTSGLPSMSRAGEGRTWGPCRRWCPLKGEHSIPLNFVNICFYDLSGIHVHFEKFYIKNKNFKDFPNCLRMYKSFGFLSKFKICLSNIHFSNKLKTPTSLANPILNFKIEIINLHIDINPFFNSLQSKTNQEYSLNTDPAP